MEMINEGVAVGQLNCQSVASQFFTVKLFIKLIRSYVTKPYRMSYEKQYKVS